MNRRMPIAAAVALALFAAGCSGNKEIINRKDMRISRLEDRADSLRQALERERGSARTAQERLNETIEETRGRLEACIEERDGLTRMTLSEAVHFEFGSAKLTEAGKQAAERLWEMIGNYPDRRIYIEGHTDDVPIDEQYRYLFRTNWELSTARAHAVRRYLIDTHKADPARLTVSGFGEYHPVADNGTPEGRRKNRRVVITIRDAYGKGR